MSIKLSLAKKIWLSLGLLLVGYFISLAFGFVTGRQNEARLIAVSEYLFPASNSSRQALTAFKDQVRLYNDGVMMGDEAIIESAGAKAKEAGKQLGAIFKMEGLGKARRDAAGSVMAALDAFTKDAQPAYAAMAAGDENAMKNKAAGLADRTGKLQASLTELQNGLAEHLKAELLTMVSGSKRLRYLNIYVFLGVVIIVGILTAFIINRSITSPIHRIIEELGGGANRVAATSGQVAEAGESLSQGASEQASSVEETSSSLEEMAAMIRQNAQNTGEADGYMKNANLAVDKAGDAMARLSNAMEEITTASEETQKIIKTIDEIAFQTNLLALNAAVEAARAGEAGAGFAVVADEVRSLAMRAAEAAGDTASLIENTIKAVEIGNESSQSTQSAIQENKEISEKVGLLVEEITAASNEQTRGIEQMNGAMSEIDRVVQQMASSSEEYASVSQELSGQSNEMKTAVGELITLVDGEGKNNVAMQIDPDHSTGHEAMRARLLPRNTDSNTERHTASEESFTDF